MSLMIRSTGFAPAIRNVLQAMTGTRGDTLITWCGEGVTLITIPVEPMPQTYDPAPSPVTSRPHEPTGQPPVASAGRRGVADIRRLLHNTTMQLIEHDRGQDHNDNDESADDGLLPQADTRDTRLKPGMRLP